MPRFTQDEYDAEIAEARYKGAVEISQILGKLTDLGLGLGAVAGAMEGRLGEMESEAIDARAKAVNSKPAPAPADA